MKKLKLGWHFDFHCNKDVPIGERPDAAGVVDALVAAGVDEVTTFAKDHVGFTFYPTDVLTCVRHPKMVGDPFGDLVMASKERGLSVLAYISFGIDGEGSRQNPHWLKHFENGPHSWSEWFAYVCPFTSYTDECVLPQVEEILQRYPVNGFFFDTMSALAPCFCPTCTREFAAKYNLELPRSAESENAGLYGQWRHDRSMALLDRISRFIQERHLGAVVCFNQVGSLPFPEKMPTGCTRLSLDFCTQGPQSRQASRCAAYGSTCPISADVMPTIFNGGWADWTPAPARRHEQIAASIWARSAGVCMGDRLHPDNRLALPSSAVIKQLGKLKTAMEAEMPDKDARLSPDALILHAESIQYGANMEYFSIDPRERMVTVEGAADLLLDAGVNFGIVAEYALANWIDRIKLVVLPELVSYSEKTDRLLKEFVSRGGQLLIIGRVPTVNGRPIDWAGVVHENKPWQDHIYLPPLGTNDVDPVLVRGAYHPTIAEAKTQVLARAIAPIGTRHGVKFGWGLGPPTEELSPHAILTCKSTGTRGGAVWVLAAPLCSDFSSFGNWQQVHYISTLIQRIVPRPLARIDSPTGNIELVACSNERSLWVTLIHHGGEQLIGTSRWPRTLDVLPQVNVELVVRNPGNFKPAAVRSDMFTLNWHADDDEGSFRIPLKLDRVWQVIRLDWARDESKKGITVRVKPAVTVFR